MTCKASSIASLFDLTGRSAVVTGAALGLGFAIARRLGQAGASVIMTDINREAVENSARRLREEGLDVQAQVADSGKEADLVALFHHVAQQPAGIDILVNNAGIYPVAGILDMTADQWRDVMRINLESAFICTREAGRLMVEQGRGGAIVNLASLASYKPCMPGLAHYGASKGAVTNLTRSTALELAPYRIRANSVAPGTILTEGLKANLAKSEGNLDDLLKELGSSVPLGGFAEPDEIAKGVLYLVSDASSYVTGTTLLIDGGAMLV